MVVLEIKCFLARYCIVFVNNPNQVFLLPKPKQEMTKVFYQSVIMLILSSEKPALVRRKQSSLCLTCSGQWSELSQFGELGKVYDEQGKMQLRAQALEE